MVSKITVAALVLIVSCPILLGYAMNIDEVTKYSYEPNNDSTNITELLQNGGIFTDTHANLYQLNTSFVVDGGSNHGSMIMPVYAKGTANNNTSLKTQYYTYGRPTDYGEEVAPTAVIASRQLSDLDYMFYQCDWPGYGDYLTLQILDSDGLTVLSSYDRLHTFYWDKQSLTLEFSYYDGSGNLHTDSILPPTLTDQLYFKFVKSGDGFSCKGYMYRSPLNTDLYYIDLSSGFYFRDSIMNAGQSYDFCAIKLPDRTYNALLTVNLDSITDANYSITIDNQYSLEKKTVGSEVTWSITDVDDPTITYDLYYDPTITDNTYQFYFEMGNIRDSPRVPEDPLIPGYIYYDYNLTLKYVGDWPTTIGVANSYMDYQLSKTLETYSSNVSLIYLDRIRFNDASITPVMRVDDAYFNGMERPAIQDKVLKPYLFKGNPSTKLANILVPGDSILFAGETYTVNNGKLHVGTKYIDLNNLVFSSVQVDGGYENRINGSPVNVTANPSDIKFVGTWDISVSVSSTSAKAYSSTTWTPGQFGWDGIDQNFLMVGMLTAIGVFVGLGIYARSHNMRIWPVLLVCGGAIILFFCMI